MMTTMTTTPTATIGRGSIQKLWDSHNTIIQLSAIGIDVDRIAEQVGLPVGVVVRFIDSPVTQDRIVRFRTSRGVGGVEVGRY